MIMFTKYVTESTVSERKLTYVFLALFSAYGAAVGVMSAYYADDYFLSLMRVAPCKPVSIVSLLVVILLPFLITAAVSFIEKPYLLLPIAFFKSLSYSLVLVSTWVIYSFAGWLVSGFMLLTDTTVNVLLHWYWIRHINGFRKTARSDLFFAFLVTLVIGIIDLIVISPYLTALMNS